MHCLQTNVPSHHRHAPAFMHLERGQQGFGGTLVVNSQPPFVGKSSQHSHRSNWRMYCEWLVMWLLLSLIQHIVECCCARNQNTRFIARLRTTQQAASSEALMRRKTARVNIFQVASCLLKGAHFETKSAVARHKIPPQIVLLIPHSHMLKALHPGLVPSVHRAQPRFPSASTTPSK